jgi:peroxiredoxin
MSIQVGDKLPSVKLKHLTSEGLQEIDTGEFFAGKKVVLFGVAGAFTPTCTRTHLPGYVDQLEVFKQKGVDAIACLAVNDPFVMSVWSEHCGATGKVTMLPDGNGDFTRALGLELDGRGAGLGTRCKRFSMTVEDGEVKSLHVEENASNVVVSGANTCLTEL